MELKGTKLYKGERQENGRSEKGLGAGLTLLSSKPFFILLFFCGVFNDSLSVSGLYTVGC
jgi:hypothetical protein